MISNLKLFAFITTAASLVAHNSAAAVGEPRQLRGRTLPRKLTTGKCPLATQETGMPCGEYVAEGNTMNQCLYGASLCTCDTYNTLSATWSCQIREDIPTNEKKDESDTTNESGAGDNNIVTSEEDKSNTANNSGAGDNNTADEKKGNEYLPCPEEDTALKMYESCAGHTPGQECIYGYGNWSCNEDEEICEPESIWTCYADTQEWGKATIDYCQWPYPDSFGKPCDPCPAKEPEPGESCTHRFHVGYSCDYDSKYECSESGWSLVTSEEDESDTTNDFGTGDTITVTSKEDESDTTNDSGAGDNNRADDEPVGGHTQIPIYFKNSERCPGTKPNNGDSCSNSENGDFGGWLSCKYLPKDGIGVISCNCDGEKFSCRKDPLSIVTGALMLRDAISATVEISMNIFSRT